MKPTCARCVTPLIFGLLLPVFAFAEGPGLPVIEGRETLAAVNGEAITVDFFLRELAALHQPVPDEEAGRSKQDPAKLLERLIDIRLVLQEARNIGLDELPRTRKAVAAFEKDTLKRLLFQKHTENIREVEPKEIEARYRETVKEVRVRTALLAAEEDARQLASRVEGGGDFVELAGELVEESKAELEDDTQYLKVSELLPEVHEVVSTMKAGEVSLPVPVGAEFAVFQLLDVRFPDDPEVRRKLEEKALQRKRALALREYMGSLKDKWVRLDQELFDELDYEAADPGFDALLQDERVLAEIEGEEPVRILDLTLAIQREFFHGIERAIESKKVNDRKIPLLDRLLFGKLIGVEARRLELERTEDYGAIVQEYENSLLFQTFVEKIVEPDLSLTEAELKAHLAEHLDEFSSPEMLRIDTLAFDAKEDAEKALIKLRTGTDFAWLRANAGGQSDPDREGGILEFPDRLVVASALPEKVRQVVTGSATGDFQLYAPEGGPFYVLRLREVVPPSPQPYEGVRQDIAQHVFGEKRQAALDDWIAKLRAASEIEVFATADSLGRLLGGMAAEGS